MPTKLKKICMATGLSVCSILLHAQHRDSAQRSPYLGQGWLRGIIDLTDQRRLPEPGHNLFFNYDKLHERLYVTDGISKERAYPSDSVDRFTLVGDNDTEYRFEKVPLISRSHFLQPLVSSVDGYSIYRRVITKMKVIPTSYGKGGWYYATGKGNDQYFDSFNYYVVYPGNRRFMRVNLNVRSIKKALSPDSVLVDKFFARNSGQVDEDTFLVLVRYLNDKK